jgi:Flp pilus assembly protein protease CpaA
MKERVEKIESISIFFMVMAWLSLITCVVTFMLSLLCEMELFFISLYFLGAYISCLCMQYFFYALYVVAKGSVKYLNNKTN